PHRVLVKLTIESTIHIDVAVWIGEEHWTGDGRGRMRGSGACPARCYSVPEPGIAQVISSVESAEEHDFLGNRIVGHLSGSTCQWPAGVQTCPGGPVERPGIIEMSPAIESAKHDYFSADRIVGHRNIGARRRGIGRRKSRPGWGGIGDRRSRGYQQGNPTTYTISKSPRTKADLIKKHNAE